MRIMPTHPYPTWPVQASNNSQVFNFQPSDARRTRRRYTRRRDSSSNGELRTWVLRRIDINTAAFPGAMMFSVSSPIARVSVLRSATSFKASRSSSRAVPTAVHGRVVASASVRTTERVTSVRHRDSARLDRWFPKFSVGYLF